MEAIALAGKPNAGKSTFFKAATMADVDVANYPFTTIDANRGITYVRTRCPCLDRDRRCDAETCHEGKRYVPVELIDVAGLVPGAHEGRGLGNQFLDELTNADAILNVVDASGGTTAEGESVEVGTHDPMEDVGFVERELEYWLAGIIERNWESIERQSRSPTFDFEQALTETLTGLGVSEAQVTTCLRTLSYPSNPGAWDDDDRLALAQNVRELTKPIVVVANKADVAPGELMDQLIGSLEHVIPTTADGELALRRAAEASFIDYDPGDETFDIVGDISPAQERGLDQIAAVMDRYDGTGVQQALNYAVFDVLDMITVYPVENETRWTDGSDVMLPDAVLLPAGSSPVDLAYAVHSDIGDGYLHAVDARSGRDIGEGYSLADGDVIKIVSTA